MLIFHISIAILFWFGKITKIFVLHFLISSHGMLTLLHVGNLLAEFSLHYFRMLQDKARKATGMQIDATEDGYIDHELFSLSSIKVCFHFETPRLPLPSFLSRLLSFYWF